MALQTQAPVPARWRFLFAAVIPLLFFAAALVFSWPKAAPVRESASEAVPEYLNARIRLQTAALAFASGKLDPDIAVITDRPELYAPEQAPAELAYYEVPKFWGRIINSGIEYSLTHALPREFRPLSGLPVIADPRDRESWDIFLDRKLSPGRFDMILLDCAFPAKITASGISLWTSQTFAALAQARANAGTVFAVVLPQDRPQAAACAMTAMKNVFGNAGTIRFGERIIAISTVPMAAAMPPESMKDALLRTSPEEGDTQPPVFDLDDINDRASLAGYYAGGDVPLDAISVVLQQDCSDAPPAWLLETMHGNRNRLGQNIGALAYVKAEILPHLRKHLPGGVPYGKICAWGLGIALLVYLILRYFISWKPVHKQTFLAFEDMFLLTGCLAIFCTALMDFLPYPMPWLRWIWFTALPLLSLVFLLSFIRPAEVRSRATRIIYLLAGCACYALAFWLEQLAAPSGFFRQILMVNFFLLPIGLLSDLIQTRIQEPVQPGAAIPLAFVLGVAASLAMLAVSLFFPAGPMVFTAVICGFRLVCLDN